MQFFPKGPPRAALFHFTAGLARQEKHDMKYDLDGAVEFLDAAFRAKPGF